MTPLQSVRSMLQILIRAETPPISRETIELQVSKVLGLNDAWRAQFSAETLVDDMERMFAIHVGKPGTLADDSDHLEWLDARRESIAWQYWERYRTYVTSSLPGPAVDSLNETTDEILRRLEDPRRPGAWDRRGLVVGHVQSGKTGNYTGLICKAADAGYQVIVVLSGIHKSLRSQTQIRLDEGFLGYDSTQASGRSRVVGVGEFNRQLTPNTATNRHDEGDFSLEARKHLSFHPGENPVLFVVKKNRSVLNNLLDWVDFVTRGQPVLRDVPLLVIDDEADHASVDTGNQEMDAAGRPDLEHEPKAINRCIRLLLRKFEKSAYVGYTATPFANIFIHEAGETAAEGGDLFPRSFIINLPAPSNYVGPVRVFGLDEDISPDLEGSPALPLVRHVDDFADSLEPDEERGWMPPKHSKEHVPLVGGEQGLPPSLTQAIQAFVLACAARAARQQHNVHNSMLIHVTRFVDVQNLVFAQVEDALADIVRKLKLGEGARARSKTLLSQLEELWTSDFVRTQKAIVTSAALQVSWAQVREQLLAAAEKIQVRRINGSAKDILDYKKNEDTGVSLIAVGGDKLSRGLTLEGLSVTYFLRASRMYDTLMQMGRWFGYRDGYLDLCRLYMPEELSEWFQHIAAASEELRLEFDRMVAVGGTPRDYGLKVRSHPALMVTSLVKMRNGTEIDLSFSGGISETVVFNREGAVLESNFSLLNSFVAKLGPAENNPTEKRPGGGEARWDGSKRWRGVAAADVCHFLRNIKTHPRARWVNGKLLASFIEKQRRLGELTEWTVAVIGKKDRLGEKALIAGMDTALIERAYEANELNKPRFTDRYTIRRLLNPRDETIDLDEAKYARALEETQRAFRIDPGHSRRTSPPESPSGPAIRAQRPRQSGLLLIYPLDWTGKHLEKDVPVVGFGVSFPASTTTEPVEWQVNNVYWQQEFGA
jgi:hypothetical protein